MLRSFALVSPMLLAWSGAVPALASEEPCPAAACLFTLERGKAEVDPDGKTAETWVLTCHRLHGQATGGGAKPGLPSLVLTRPDGQGVPTPR